LQRGIVGIRTAGSDEGKTVFVDRSTAASDVGVGRGFDHGAAVRGFVAEADERTGHVGSPLIA
jgi:hypothetical protein